MKSVFVLIVFSLSLSAAHAAKPESKKCAFGREIDEISENSRFEVSSGVIKTFKVMRSVQNQLGGIADKPVMVEVSVIKDRKTGKVYHMNTTFRHIDDGDNTSGWIEEVNDAASHDGGIENEGRVVADIGDSFLGDCQIK